MPVCRSPIKRSLPSRFRHSPYAAALLMFGAVPMPSKAAEGAQQLAAAQTLSEVKVVGERRDGDYKPETSTVGAKQPTAPRDIPQTVTVIDRAVLDAQGATSLVDALRNVPGITIGAGEGGQIGNNINLRGFSARTDIYLDGFRDRGQYQRDSFSLDAVEVLEGPSSLLFGRGSTGGVINQVSKRPELQPIGDIELTAGTGDDYRTTLDIDQRLSPTSAFRVAAMGQDVKPTRDVAENKDYGLAPSLRFGIGTPTEVSLSLLSQHNNDIPDYGFPLIQFAGQPASTPIDAPRRRYYGYTNDNYDQDVNVFGVDVSHRFAEDLKLRSNTQYSVYRTQAAATPLGRLVSLDSNGNYQQLTAPPPAGTPLDALTISVQQRDRSIRDSSLFNQTDLLIERRTGVLLHHLAVGTEIGRDEYRNDYFGWYNFNYNNGAGLGANNVDVFTLGARAYGAKPSGPNVFRVPANVTDTDADTLAAYFNDQIDIGSHWKLIAGLRWDQYTANQDYLLYCYQSGSSCPGLAAGSLSDPDSGLITSNSDPSQTAAVQAHNASVLSNGNPALSRYSSSHTDYRFSTRAGLMWQPDLVQSYYISYGTSFNPLAEAVAGLPTSADKDSEYQAAGGEAPETTASYEVGGKWDVLHQGLSLSAAAFRVQKDHARNLDPTTQTYTLAGKVRVDGVEWKVVGQLLPGWQLIGGWTWLDGEIVSSPVLGNAGSVPQNTPRNTATLWTTYDFMRHWQVGGGMTYSTNVWANNTNTAQVPGYTRYDATLAYLQPRWSLRLNLLNLSDETYFQSFSGGRATPADGRRALLSFGYRFL